MSFHENFKSLKLSHIGFSKSTTLRLYKRNNCIHYDFLLLLYIAMKLFSCRFCNIVLYHECCTHCIKMIIEKQKSLLYSECPSVNFVGAVDFCNLRTYIQLITVHLKKNNSMKILALKNN